VALDSKFYQLKADGSASEADDQMETLLATVNFFDYDQSFCFLDESSLADLLEIINSRIRSKNIFYAVRIDGNFDYIKTRSIPTQEEPHIPLAEAVKEQTTLEFSGININGTVVAFRYPEFATGLALPGYHMHFIFINGDRSSGGHLLDARAKNATILIYEIRGLGMLLPQDREFHQADISEEKQEELEQGESNSN
jgi:acetolactate decarboxylase